MDLSNLVAGIALLLVALLGLFRPVLGFIALLSVTPFAELFLHFGLGAGIPDLSFSRALTAGLAIAFVAREVRASDGLLRSGLQSMDGFALMTLFVLVVFLPRAVDSDAAQRAVTLLGMPLASYFFGRSFIRDSRELHWVFASVVALAVVLALYAILEAETQHVWLKPSFGTPAPLYHDRDQSLWLLQGVMGRSGNFARVMLFGVPLGFYLMQRGGSALQSNGLVAAVGLMACALVLTFSRTAWIACLLEIALAMWFFGRVRFRMLISLALGIALAGFLLAEIPGQPQAESDSMDAPEIARPERVSEPQKEASVPGPAAVSSASESLWERVTHKLATLHDRIPRWIGAVRMWSEKPFLGWGYGESSRRAQDYYAGEDHKPYRSVESDYLQILVDGGLVLLLPYILFLAIPFFAAWRGLRTSEGNGASALLALLACLGVAMVLPALASVLNHQSIKTIAFGLFGCIVTERLRARRAESSA